MPRLRSHSTRFDDIQQHPKRTSLVSSTVDISAVSAISNGGDGLYARDGEVTLNDSYFNNNGAHGASFEGTTAQMSTYLNNSEFSINAKSGLYFQNALVSLDASTTINNNEYGLECSSATFSLCSVSSISGNTSGEQTGCDATCGVEANPTP